MSRIGWSSLGEVCRKELNDFSHKGRRWRYISVKLAALSMPLPRLHHLQRQTEYLLNGFSRESVNIHDTHQDDSAGKLFTFLSILNYIQLRRPPAHGFGFGLSISKVLTVSRESLESMFASTNYIQSKHLRSTLSSWCPGCPDQIPLSKLVRPTLRLHDVSLICRTRVYNPCYRPERLSLAAHYVKSPSQDEPSVARFSHLRRLPLHPHAPDWTGLAAMLGISPHQSSESIELI